MEFLRHLPLPLQILFFLVYLHWVYRLWRNRRQAVEDYPEVAYQPASNAAVRAWRWAPPPPELGLAVEQKAMESWIHLRPVRSGFEVYGSFIGLFLAVVSLFLVVKILVHSVGDPAPFPLGLFLFGVGILTTLIYAIWIVDGPVTSLGRTSDRLILKVRMAAVLHRTVVYRKSGSVHLKFSGKVQSALSMNLDQLDRLPDYYLTVKRFGFSRRFLIRCNQSQGSWLLGGIHQWCRTTSSPETTNFGSSSE